MNKLLPLLAITTTMLCACISPYTPHDGQLVEIRSSHPIVEINGQETDNPYLVHIAPGSYSMLVQRKTYLTIYICRFEIELEAARRYEIIDAEKKEPLTLYRWEYRNSLWSARRKPIAPSKCQQQTT